MEQLVLISPYFRPKFWSACRPFICDWTSGPPEANLGNMNDKTNVRDLNPMFERLLDALETGLDLASRADRDDRLAEIGEHLALAMRLSTDALAGRG